MNKQNKNELTHRNIVFSVSTVIFAALVLFFYVVSNLPAVSSWFKGVFGVLTPVIGGAAIAYLANPILNFFEEKKVEKKAAGKTAKKSAPKAAKKGNK